VPTPSKIFVAFARACDVPHVPRACSIIPFDRISLSRLVDVVVSSSSRLCLGVSARSDSITALARAPHRPLRPSSALDDLKHIRALDLRRAIAFPSLARVDGVDDGCRDIHTFPETARAIVDGTASTTDARVGVDRTIAHVVVARDRAIAPSASRRAVEAVPSRRFVVRVDRRNVTVTSSHHASTLKNISYTTTYTIFYLCFYPIMMVSDTVAFVSHTLGVFEVLDGIFFIVHEDELTPSMCVKFKSLAPAWPRASTRWTTRTTRDRDRRRERDRRARARARARESL